MSKKEIILVLHDIRSAQNVGAIFRTADGVGVSRIIISGYTPAPVDRFGRERKDISKTALGAEKTIPFKVVKNITNEIKKFKNEGFEIVCLEQSEESIDYKKYKPKNKVVFIVGNEVLGVSKNILEKSDKIIEIPMRGQKESLNVSVATGVALFRIFDF